MQRYQSFLAGSRTCEVVLVERPTCDVGLGVQCLELRAGVSSDPVLKPAGRPKTGCHWKQALVLTLGRVNYPLFPEKIHLLPEITALFPRPGVCSLYS